LLIYHCDDDLSLSSEEFQVYAGLSAWVLMILPKNTRNYGWKVNDTVQTGKSVRKLLAFVPVVHCSYFQSPIAGAISFAL